MLWLELPPSQRVGLSESTAVEVLQPPVFLAVMSASAGVDVPGSLTGGPKPVTSVGGVITSGADINNAIFCNDAPRCIC
eukprot:scaffold66391_cov60-Phaeocystis_antarctica.AAC.2